ncbi:hypothetical protein K402DRAFT_391827 [Aulographum hederae CBS 113979]|uniref:DNA helicase n=1 Tax=Aulographum hederae CBS 113979 TaxID=1176131 RepID=A0A6G1H5V8_9PEZI|nr:hypothetical protein K402DRAFT_391827 [Aulographum hederae CBS 113979]
MLPVSPAVNGDNADNNNNHEDISTSQHTSPQPSQPSQQPPTPLHDVHHSTEIHTNGTTEQVSFARESESEGGKSKKRKFDAITKSRTASRGPSPPWKKVEAEGPTSVIVNGARRSTRTGPPVPVVSKRGGGQRRTRAASSSKTRPSYASLHNGTSAESTPASSKGKAKHASLTGKSSSQPQFKVPSHKASHKVKATAPSSTQSSRSHTNGSTSTRRRESNITPVNRRRSARNVEAHADSDDGASPNAHNDRVQSDEITPNRFQRLKLRVRDPVMVKTHPGHWAPRKKYTTFEEFLEQDDPLEGEESQRITDQSAIRIANVLSKALEESKPGGLLSEERCSLFASDKPEEPPPKYGVWSHIVSHAENFHKLMGQERRRHEHLAKKTAQACASEVATNPKWARFRMPVDHEQLEEEWRGHALKRYKQLVKDLEARWDMVKDEVNAVRMRRYEEEQDELAKQNMDVMLDKSRILLDQRRMMRRSSGVLSDGDDTSLVQYEYDDEESPSQVDEADDASGSDSQATGQSADEPDSDVMSSDESEDEGNDEVHDDDAGLSREELLVKYSQALDAENEATENEEDDVEEDDETGGMEDGAESSNGLQALVNGVNHHASPDVEMADAEHEGLDMSGVELEEVDPMLLDDSDEASDEDDEDDEDSEEGSGTEADTEEGDSESEDENPLLGFFAPKTREELVQTAPNDDTVPDDDAIPGEDDAIPGDADAATGDFAVKVNGHTEDGKILATEDDEAGDQATTEAPDSLGGKKSLDSDEMDVDAPEPITNGFHSPEPDKMDADVTDAIKTRVPSLLRGTLREYQHYGLDWLAGLYANNTNGILADEMGLGKTIQTISLLAHLAVDYGIWGPHLVVVPTSVILNWEMEFKKFLPGFKILTYYGNVEERKKKRQGWLNDDLYNVCITSYQLILQDAQAFKRRNWHYLILDEAHNIKNFQTQRWQTLLGFKTRARLLLTGTPLQNNLNELWSLLFFLMPTDANGQSKFSELEQFVGALKAPTNQILDQGRQQLDKKAQEAVNRLHTILRPYLLRRLKADVEKQMPGKYEHVVYCRLSKRQRQLYDGFMQRADTRQTLASGNYMSIINCLMSLRKVCNHPDLFETRQIVTSFAMPKSAVADYEIKELLVRRRLLAEDHMEAIDLDFVGLKPAANESMSAADFLNARKIQATAILQDLVEQQSCKTDSSDGFDGSSISATLSQVNAQAKASALEHLQSCLAITKSRMARQPIYGKGLRQRLDARVNLFRTVESKRPDTGNRDIRYKAPLVFTDLITPTDKRSAELESTIQKFTCITPAVVTGDLTPLALTTAGTLAVQNAQLSLPSPFEPDPFHEARIRQSIAFPDKRLLQYDCGKLQRLEKLLRDLQAGGHRALIFTQMTKVLDILEQFLNIHGHRYLRLDGATKIEQRQILTDRFNNDPRILAFILSSRSGGLGINLTGADTVIFYDLDWNPAMDKQCQDRCHRIGQTRDVHIYRFVSEYTIEANILRKSNQKRLLDDVIIQKGEFTTDFFNRVDYKDALDDGDGEGMEDEAAAAMDRVLGDVTGLNKVIESAEDEEDAVAAKVAQKEIVVEDAADKEDFNESMVVGDTATSTDATPKTSVPPTPAAGVEDAIAVPKTSTDRSAKPGLEVEVDEVLGHVDDFMVKWMEEMLRGVPLIVKRPKVRDGRDRKKKGDLGGRGRR